MENVFVECISYHQSTNTLINALMNQLTVNIERNKPVQVYRYCTLLDSLGEGRSALVKWEFHSYFMQIGSVLNEAPR